jgi:hypothetical protein
MFARSEYKGTRRIITPNNSGRPVTDARDAAVREGITINGLPILALEPLLERYFMET